MSTLSQASIVRTNNAKGVIGTTGTSRLDPTWYLVKKCWVEKTSCWRDVVFASCRLLLKNPNDLDAHAFSFSVLSERHRKVPERV